LCREKTAKTSHGMCILKPTATISIVVSHHNCWMNFIFVDVLCVCVNVCACMCMRARVCTFVGVFVCV
jgi:hypothetical protein